MSAAAVASGKIHRRLLAQIDRLNATQKTSVDLAELLMDTSKHAMPPVDDGAAVVRVLLATVHRICNPISILVSRLLVVCAP